jgi:diguanylate cyclase (GGDEF)-like protein
VAGALATVIYYLLPGHSLRSSLAYNAIGFTSGLLILLGVWLYRPARPVMWYLFSAGQILSAVGDIVWEYYDFVLHEEPYPSFADAFYVASYLPLIAGLMVLLRRRRRGGGAGVLDAAMVATGLGLALWVFVLHPVVDGESASTLERVISTAYPALDALLLAMLAGLFLDPASRTASTRLLGLAAVLLLVSDIAFSVASLHWDYDGRMLDAGWLMSYVMWAAAALHPSMAAEVTVEPGNADRVSRGRLAALGACSMLAPSLLFLPGVGDDSLDRIVIGAAAVALFLFGIARMAGFLKMIHSHAGDLQRLAMQDDLTGLSNRRHLYQAVDAALGAGQAQVALLGLSNFKAVNDEFGHLVGDRLLAELGARLRDAAGDGALVARTAGDEFAVLLAPGDPGPATVQRIAATVRDTIRVGEYELLLAAGVGFSDGTGTTEPAEVLRRAGVAMYAAKQTGEPFRRWSPVLDERASRDARLGAQMRAGLDAGEFRVVYQPIVAVPEGRVFAVEALVRWQHPQRGTVSPAEFIPVAEQNGLIVELGEWILATACRKLARWREELGDLAPEKVSVNASARQLSRPGFAAVVARTLAEAGLAPQRLTIELTETAVFQGGQAVVALHELRALGVRIALDDFGTGHSSLGMLQTVPVDILKVDKSFVDHITEEGRQAVIAKALIEISDGLGLTAVAEGVETAEQARALQRLGYRLLQGYYFGRPVAEPDFLGTPAAISA